MNIRLNSTRVSSLNMAFKETEDPVKQSFALSYAVCFPEEPHPSFLIEFDVKIESEHGYSINLKYDAVFDTDEIADEKFRQSHFPTVNAPAIAYPFLRSFIATVTLNAGYEPMLVPTVNFQKLAKKQESERSSSQLNV